MTPPADVRAAAVEAACRSFWPSALGYTDECFISVSNALTAAILELEKHGFKVTGPEATDAIMTAMDTLDADCLWREGHKAAPGWGDGV